MLEKFYHALLTNDDILFLKEDLKKVTFISNQIHTLAAYVHLTLRFVNFVDFSRMMIWTQKVAIPLV